MVIDQTHVESHKVVGGDRDAAAALRRPAIALELVSLQERVDAAGLDYCSVSAVVAHQRVRHAGIEDLVKADAVAAVVGGLAALQDQVEGPAPVGATKVN